MSDALFIDDGDGDQDLIRPMRRGPLSIGRSDSIN